MHALGSRAPGLQSCNFPTLLIFSVEKIMSMSRKIVVSLLALAAIAVVSCASLKPREPLQVTMVGMEPLPGQGLELRMLVKLRIQNPNDSALSFSGVSVQMNVQDKRFATGVSNTPGNLSAFGETVVDIPVSISMINIARQAMGAVGSELPPKLSYEMTGKLGGPAGMGFKTEGEFAMPAGQP